MLKMLKNSLKNSLKNNHTQEEPHGLDHTVSVVDWIT